jgi:S1-C subfamily serine protease
VNGSGAAITPSLGASAVVLDAATAAAAGLPQGALVRTVDPGGPAAQAGLRPGDVVTSVDGVTLDATHPLDPAALGLTPGQRTTLVVVTAGASRTLTLTVGSTAPAAQ